MSPATKNQSFLLAEHPHGIPTEKTWKVTETDVPSVNDGEFLVKALYISVDPYIRNRISQAPLNHATVSGQVAEVVETKNPSYKQGEKLVVYLPWSRFSVLTGKESGLQKLTGLPTNVNPSAALGVLGMPGLTAYCGVKHILQVKPGETVLVSGAAGAVGSLAGQLARHLYKAGRVIGTAGGSEKCEYAKEHYGFDEVIDYKMFTTVKDMRAELKRVAPNGIDAYYDNTGGVVTHSVWDLLNKYARVAVCGQISYYNATELPMVQEWLSKIIYKSVLIKGFVWSDYAVDSQGQSQIPVFLREVAPLVGESKIRFDEHVVEGFENTTKAFISLFHGANIGKVIVKVDN